MECSGLLHILVSLILLQSVQKPGLAEVLRSRRCPKIRIHCEIKEMEQCSSKKPCPGNLRCCTFSCGKKCLDPTKDVCSAPMDKGPCLAYIPRWWYNKKIEKCEQFIYGGCLGNNNNFQSESVCMVSCYKKSSVSSSWLT